MCTALENGSPLTVSVSAPEMVEKTTGMISETIDQAARATRRGPITLDVLTLSSGGQFGAFGAGFLRGWGENQAAPRPAFDLVTGVSAGAQLAPIAFAGREFDAALETFRGLSEPDVLIRRPILSVPASPSIVSPMPLEALLRQQLTEPLLTRIADRHQNDGARLLVSAVNIDTSAARVFDLGSISSGNGSLATRRDCMTEVLLASGAVPGIFPPRHIDDALYSDGGLRDHVFFQAVESARAQAARRTGREVRVNATIIINGALAGVPDRAEDSLIGYVSRSLEILADEVLRDSITEAIAFAESRPGWSVRGVFAEADISSCGAEARSGTFDACVTTILFDHGRDVGRRVPASWKTAAALRDKANEF